MYFVADHLRLQIIVDCMMLRTLAAISNAEDGNLEEIDMTQLQSGNKTYVFNKSDDIKVSGSLCFRS